MTRDELNAVLARVLATQEHACLDSDEDRAGVAAALSAAVWRALWSPDARAWVEEQARQNAPKARPWGRGME